MDLSTSTNITTFRPDGQKNPIAFAVQMCAAAGYRKLDLNFCEAMNPVSRFRDPDWERYVDEIGELGAKLGVAFTQCHLPYYDIFGDNPQEKVDLMRMLNLRTIRAAGMLGIRWAVNHPGTVYGAASDMEICRERNLEYYAPFVEEAVKDGVGIALENDFEYKTRPYQRIYCASVTELCDLADAFHSDSVGVCYDFGHANLTGGYHRQNLNRIGTRLKAVHVNDNHGAADEHLLPFFGTIDWSEAMAGLADIGFEGDLTYEVQEFGRYVPNDLKPEVVRLSLVIGEELLRRVEQAKSM